MRRLLLLGILSFNFGLMASPKSTWATDVQRGQNLAIRLCASCHLNEGQGDKQGASGIPGFVAVANRSGQTIEKVVQWLKSVPPMMPNHHLSQDEIEALAEFIMSLRGS